jgi:hypothetical protein
MDTAVVVFTRKDLATMMEYGGCGDWVADRERLATCKYVIATANAKASHGKIPESRQGHAFLVGEVSGTVVIPGDPERALLQLSRYAEVDVAGAWKKGHRNPVRYSNLSEFGLEPSKLTWKQFPSAPPRATQEVRALTVEEAKAGLAAKFGVSVDSIEITIRA